MRHVLSALAAVSLMGCVEPLEAPVEETPRAMTMGESRTIDLRFLRLDVQGFQQTLTLADLRAVPKATLDAVWLHDLPVQRFAENSLAQLRDLDDLAADAEPVAVQNMRRLMNMTPGNANLVGTNLEALTALSRSLGIPPQRTLARILQKALDEPVISLEVAARALVEGLITTHPAALTRDGPVDAAHPDGRWRVAAGALPVTLGDVVDNFSGLVERFGPSEGHPGYIVDASGFAVVEADFEMRVRINGNALPYKGLDLTDGSVAAVNSTGSQIDSLFAVDRDDWLEIEGLVDEPYIESFTVKVTETDAFVPGGTAREPLPLGNSPVWDLPPWTFERMVAEMGRIEAELVSADCVEFEVGAGTTAFESCVDDSGWVTFETFDNAGDPPPPAYLWDLQLEMAQVRLHDDGVAEGDANVEFTIHDVKLGVRAEQLTADIRDNIARNPRVLREFAAAVVETTRGSADFYYYRPDAGSKHDGDWLYFVDESDIPRADDGERRRPYAYPKPGFYGDEGLTQKVSSKVEVDGDVLHEKARLLPGTPMFAGDDAGHVYRLELAGKPSRARVSLHVTRVR